MVKKEIKVGEKVYARWPGSVKYYEAIVDEVLDDEFVVSFIEGSLTATLDERHVYRHSYFDSARSRSASSSRKRSRSPARRRSRSRSPSRRSTSTPKQSARKSPTRRGRSPGRPRKQQEEQDQSNEEKPSPARRGRPRKQDVKKPPEKTPAKSKQVVTEQTVTHLTRSMTKTMVKEEKEALFDKDKLEKDLKESRKGKSKEFEFGGPVGAFFSMIVMPILVYDLYFYCNGKDNKCSFISNPLKLPHWRKFFDEGHLIYDGWLLFQFLLFFVPIGKIVQGETQPDGTRKSYRMNGFFAVIATMAGLFALKAKQIPLNAVYDKMLSLITASIIWSLLVSIFAYIKARREGTCLASNTGNALYDFYTGHQLNPSIGKFDLKFFFGTRVGFLGWMVINFCMANHQYETMHKISPAMMIVCLFQFIYVLDIMIFESSMLSSMDFRHDGFGFMLAFASLSFLPFVYSLQARFIADHDVHIPWPFIVAIVVLKVVGYIIFRGSILQKDYFRQQPNDPDFQDKETILTPSGKRLMVFGWWKMVRHPNYLGDILMAISWTLPCGFTHVIPWFYPVFLTMLLVHRQHRDDALCRKKHGKSYEEYCRRVPYRIVPLVY